MSPFKKIVVVGAGPAGMMAAIRAGELNQDVTLVEKNPALGRKLLLSGKGRCNLTNATTLDLFLDRFSNTGQFLRDAFKRFFNQELIRFFETRGLKLKVERQLRVFPKTDRSNSIIKVLENELKKRGVKILYNTSFKDIIIRDKSVKGVMISGGSSISADRVILATGGVSYPFTGSTGEGIEVARGLGHKIVPLRPGLVALETRQKFVEKLKGLALKNIRLKICGGTREILSEIGELLFTDFGISGPLVLSLSGRIADWLAEGMSVYVEADLKPALSSEQLNLRLQREFKAIPKKTIRNTLKNLLPANLINVFIDLAKISLDKQASQITKDERENLTNLFKAFRLNIIKSRPIEEAMVTRGGVSLRDINPRTMESRLIKGLYFCGEMIDVDADTGGFNLQAAFSTGFLAGESAALS